MSVIRPADKRTPCSSRRSTLIPFLFYLPVFRLLANGAILGMMAVVFLRPGRCSWQRYFCRILPRIFELPALARRLPAVFCLAKIYVPHCDSSSQRFSLVELAARLLRVLLVVLPLTCWQR